jgi:hypothetical protein
MMKQILLFLTLTTTLWGNDYIWEQKSNWDNNTIEFNIKAPFELKDSTLSATRMKMENKINDQFRDIFLKGMLEFNISSLENIGDYINRQPGIYYELDELRLKSKPIYSRLTTNLDFIEVGYSYRIYPDLVKIFYNKTQNVKLYKDLTHWDYGKFTGLIIYVPRELPLYGKNSTGTLTPILFPAIYNQDMELIQDFTYVDPEYMEKWGIAVYSEDFDESIHQSRIGLFPLRIIAVELFGKNNGDIIITNQDSKKLKSNRENLNILTQGRILIVY